MEIKISDLQAGKAAEYMVCADLILNGYVAYLSEQGLPYDAVIDHSGKLYKIQVKATRTHRYIKTREGKNPFYMFSIGRNGKNSCRKMYNDQDVDIFAIVALDTKEIAYIKACNVRSQMNFKVTEFKGRYHNEQLAINRARTLELRGQGLNTTQIAEIMGKDRNMMYLYFRAFKPKSIHGKQGSYLTDYKITDIWKD